MMKYLIIILLITGICLSFDDYLVRIPYTDGYISAKVTVPDTPRYIEGAPVAVIVPGGHGMGSLQTDSTYANAGVIHIAYLLPGKVLGSDSTQGRWDARGIKSLKITATVMAYATGEIFDTDGGTIDDSCLCPVNHEIVGMVGMSNGGNIAVPTLALFGDMFSNCAFLVTYESPTNDQCVQFDLGGTAGDEDALCDGDDLWSFTNDDYKNVNYVSYHPIECVIDYTNLAWDSIASQPYSTEDGINFYFRGRAFLDNNHDGRITRNGMSKLDLDNDCTYEADEDFVFEPLPAAPPESGWQPKLFYTFPVTRELWNNNIIDTLNWPDTLATPGEAMNFWKIRSSVFWYDSIPQYFPELKVILIESQNDHNQTAEDYPNIRQAYDGFNRQGYWVRINPGSLWVREILPDYSSIYVQNAPNWAPAEWESLHYYIVPEAPDLPISAVALAGVLELCDRYHDTVWVIDNETTNLPVSIGLTVFPNPFNSSCQILLVGATYASPSCHSRESGNPGGMVGIEIYDINGRMVANVPSPSVPLPVGEGGKTLLPPGEGGSKSRMRAFIWTPNESITSGVYLVRVTTGDKSVEKKVVYLK